MTRLRRWQKNCELMLKIIAIGKKHEPWVATGIEHYQKRLQRPWNITWELLPHSPLDGNKACRDESERISSRCRADDFVIVLDERGKLLNSPALSRSLSQAFTSNRTPIFVIGGAYGVTDALRARANLVWSISPLVFPHQLVRLILIEQLYRAQEIARGGKYHHD